MSLLNPKTSGAVPLTYCVARVNSDLNEFSGRHYEQKLQWAINDCIDMNLHESVNVEVVYLKMDTDGIVDLTPLTDYVDYVAVGMVVNGKKWALGYNPKIAMRRDTLDQAELDQIFKTGSPAIESTGSFFPDHFINQTYHSGMLGLGGGFNRSCFNIDKELNRIQFDREIPRNQIVLEYVSSGVTLSGNTLIPASAVPRIVAYIHWQMNEHNPEVPDRTKERKRELYEIEVEKLTNFDLRFRKEDFLNMYYSVLKQTVKI